MIDRPLAIRAALPLFVYDCSGSKADLRATRLNGSSTPTSAPRSGACLAAPSAAPSPSSPKPVTTPARPLSRSRPRPPDRRRP